ncbi:MAG: MmgE/PrpD family protein [Gammaproteobacteria bacterium]|nr:MAG: MmgE/PrpD family protein [Gammaproteobacteria bacterium]
MTAVTRRLSEFAAGISYDGLPADVSERAKWLVTDLVGIALRARQEAQSTPSLLAAVERLGLARGEASVIGEDHGYTPPGAALTNGTLAHSLDFDDTHAAGSIHPSAPIVPAALAAAEMTGANGRELIAGIVAGYEVQIRLSLALIPKEHYDRGFHPSATCGVFGAAAAAGRVFGLSAHQIADAFGIALSQAAGSLQFLVGGAWTKRLQVGYAAMSGLIAASLARDGFKGAVEAIEGKAGFLRAYAPHPVIDKAVDGLGQVYETMAIAVKPYPSCRYSHAALDALIALRAANDIDAQEIESVEIGLPRTGWNIIGDPEEAKQRPRSVVDGQFSMPFLAAVALREGRMRWDDYARHIDDADTLALCKRVQTVVDPKAEAEFPAQMSGIARVRTKRGSFEKFVVIPKGEPENFFSQDELRAKFDSLVGPYLSARRRGELANALLALEQAGDIGMLLRLARPEQAAERRAAAGAD